MSEVIEQFMSLRGAPSFTGVPPEVVVSAFTGLTLGLIQAWIAHDPLPPPETTAEWMTRVVVREEEPG